MRRSHGLKRTTSGAVGTEARARSSQPMRAPRRALSDRRTPDFVRRVKVRGQARPCAKSTTEARGTGGPAARASVHSVSRSRAELREPPPSRGQALHLANANAASNGSRKVAACLAHAPTREITRRTHRFRLRMTLPDLWFCVRTLSVESANFSVRLF